MGECNLAANPETYYGFRDTDGDFRSIMAYNCKTTQCDSNPNSSCTRVQRFSFPGDYVTGGTNMGRFRFVPFRSVPFVFGRCHFVVEPHV